MDDSAHIMWKLIGGEDRAQGVFEDLVKSALLYRLKGFKKGLFPVDALINDAIFNLNAHDQVPRSPDWNTTLHFGSNLCEIS